MGDVINATFTPKQTDGGKARIQARHERLNLADDLTMDHADPADYMPSEYVAPDHDPA